MDLVDELPELAIVASGVFVVAAPTPLQVVWLIALAVVVIARRRLRGLGLGDGPQGGGGGGGLRV
ncbi:hypothetical protein LQ327_28620 [Actinomycetospora endophytica]|uniref:Secreted protein with PEP-CTERM sorting signal n=1 Tax=Actinomycetospora endophytica TaxID=2291215 RepID=A0ABS8PGP2_9PSEU|nr:hypothetical protein [Actinomycetospora endophytica]MCD2197344.1 hypothetical protein [Actinomycetospora endophytica]